MLFLRQQLTVVGRCLLRISPGDNVSGGQSTRLLTRLLLSRIRHLSSSETGDDTKVVGPGASSPSLIATPYEQAAGAERIELLGELSGRSAFLMAPLVVDHYGTPKDPIRVDSVEGVRLVGCTGFPKYSHEPLWFWVEHGHDPIRCLECGQAFAINKLK